MSNYIRQIKYFILLLQVLLVTINAFDDTATVLAYIASGYLYQDPVQPNTNQLTSSQYFARYSQYNIPDPAKPYQTQLIQAANIADYAVLNVPATELDSTQATLQQQILVYFYNNYSKVYSSYYKYDKINNSNQSVTFIIDPCKHIAAALCIETSTTFVDQPSIVGGNDMRIAFNTNTTILHCSEEWSKLINCGSFIEIHRPFDPYIIEQIKIEVFQTPAYQFYFFSTKQLCAGRYEIWYVVRTRIGVILQYTKPFFVSYPSCSCAYNIYLSNTIPCS